MDDLELIKIHLQRTPVSKLYSISRETGIPYSTLWNLKKKNTKNPRFQTVKPLAAHFKSKAP